MVRVEQRKEGEEEGKEEKKIQKGKEKRTIDKIENGKKKLREAKSMVVEATLKIDSG